MKKLFSLFLAVLLIISLGACKNEPVPEDESKNSEASEDIPDADIYKDAVLLELEGNSAKVNGAPAEESDFVTLGGEIIYYHDMEKYPSGNPYGEGTKDDMHTEKEADEHTLVTITKPGDYLISGKLKGQLAVDLGKEAKNNPEAKVTLIFSGADVECEIAPAVIFYNVFECADGKNTDDKVDTSKAGANVIIADGSENNIKGENVARIYKDNGKEEKLHKYDGAFYSKMSMNISGGKNNSGILNIVAGNEGLDSEMHLTINGGIINIESMNDGINVNEDGISVFTLNGGELTINAGLGSEGDGIDSNGWLTVNGGKLLAYGKGSRGDGGIDADKGIMVNGGEVAAFGHRNDVISKNSAQNYVRLVFGYLKKAGTEIEFLDAEGNGISAKGEKEFLSVVFSSPVLEKDKEYNLYSNGILQEYGSNVDYYSTGSTEDIAEGFINERDKNTLPEGFEEWLESDENIPENIREWLEEIADEMPEKEQKPAEKDPEKPQEQKEPEKSSPYIELHENGNDNTVFILTEQSSCFSGIYDSVKGTGKERVNFRVNGSGTMEDFLASEGPEIILIEASEKIDPKHIQLTLVYEGKSEDITVSRSCLLSDGYKKINALFEGLEQGKYCLTVAVTDENSEYTGSTEFRFFVWDEI